MAKHVCVCLFSQIQRTSIVLCDPWVGLLRAQVFPHHLLQRAHEHGDEAVDVAGIVAAGRLQYHQRSWRTGEQDGEAGEGRVGKIGNTII